MSEYPPSAPHPSVDDPRTWVGVTVVGSQRELLGYLGPVYSDDATGRPAWVVVYGTRRTAVVPLEVTHFDGEAVHLPFGAQELRTAPHHDPDNRISYQDGDDLYRHYGFTPPARHPAPEPSATDHGAGGDAVMVRSQEQLRAGREIVVVGRVRLRKHLVTEDQTFVVPVNREEITIDYDEMPPEQRTPHAGTGLSEDTYEVVRYEERVVITKEFVPVERVRMVRRVVTTDQTVVGQVNTELIDVDETDLPNTSIT